MSNVAAQAASRMHKVGLEVERANRVAVNGAALAAKTVILGSLDRVTTGRTLRNVGTSGARLGVSYNVKGTKSPTALLRATGPWHLIEGTSKPHEIRPKGARRRGGGKKALATPWGPRAFVQHPGVRNPQRPWAKGRPAANAAATKVIDRTYRSAFRRGATK